MFGNSVYEKYKRQLSPRFILSQSCIRVSFIVVCCGPIRTVSQKRGPVCLFVYNMPVCVYTT